MAFTNEQTEGDWTLRYMTRDGKNDGECDFFIEAKEPKNHIGKIEIMMEDFGEHTGYPRAQKLADAKLIGESKKLRQFAEMLYDYWSSQNEKPFLLKSLKETLEAAGVKITH
jgi:hypothetical protein